MYQSEKNFLERMASHIPGIKGYRDKESRRETDKRLRDWLAAELDRDRAALEGFKRDALAKGQLDALDLADRVARKLQRAADSIRFASYGFGGVFDQVKVGEAELDRLYQCDSDLAGQVKALGDRTGALAAGPEAPKALGDLEAAAESLCTLIDGRRQVFNDPS